MRHPERSRSLLSMDSPRHLSPACQSDLRGEGSRVQHDRGCCCRERPGDCWILDLDGLDFESAKGAVSSGIPTNFLDCFFVPARGMVPLALHAGWARIELGLGTTVLMVERQPHRCFGDWTPTGGRQTVTPRNPSRTSRSTEPLTRREFNPS